MTHKSVLTGYLFLIFSLIYLYVFLQIPNDLLWDRDNYLIYAHSSSNIISTYDSFLDYISGDYIFLLINSFLFNFFPDYIVVNILVGFVIISYLFFLHLKSKNLLLFFVGVFSSVVILPIFHFQLVTIRQAIATVLFIYGIFFLKEKKNIFILLIFCSLIHSVYYLILIFFFLNFFIFSKLNFILRYFFVFLSALLVSLIYLGLGQLLGFRQAESYSSYDGGVGGGAFILWAIVLFYIFKYGNKNETMLYHYSLMGLIVYSVFYLFANVTVAARVSEAVLPMVLILLVSKGKASDFVLIFIINLAYLLLWFNGGMYGLMFEASEVLVKIYFSDLFQKVGL